jgi:glycosyltransferase involved in cell wall biosynthesis
MKTISIIIPVYNVEKYIVRCLDSICNQTFDNIECILVDDCGNDKSMNIAENYIRSYQGNIQFKLLYHQKNKGQATARNTGMRDATGDFIYFMDSDDAITPDCLDTLICLSEQYPDADFVQANTVTDKSKDLMPYTFNIVPPEYCNDKLELNRLILASLTMTVWNRLVKRSFLIENNLFFPDGILCEDMYWIYFLAKEVRAAAFTSQGTYLYYKNNNSDANSMSKTSRYRHYQGQMVAANAFFYDIRNSKHINIYQRQYFAGNLVAAMGNLAIVNSLRHWSNFWRLVCKISWTFKTKITISRLILFFIMMPPFCFLSGVKGWMWRIKKYIVSNV